MATNSLYSRIISKLRHWATWHTYIVALLIGITSLSFDFKRKKFCNSQYIRLYGVLINTTLIIAAPIVHSKIVNNVSFYQDNLQMKFINTINITLRTGTAIVCLLLRWSSEPRLKRIIERLVALEEEYYQRISYPRQVITKFEKLFLLQYTVIWLLILAGLYVVYRFVNYTFPWWHLTILYTVITMSINYGLVLHFSMCLLHIAARFHIIIFRLKEIYTTLARARCATSPRSKYLLQKTLAVEMEYITGMHVKLMDIVAELNDCYKYYLLINLGMHVFNNIAMGYYDISLCNNYKKFNLTYCDYVLGTFTYCGLVLYLYLTDVGCSILENSYFGAGASLKKFSQFFNMKPDFDKSCELLSLHLVQTKLKIRICGMFDLNKKNSFLICAFTLSQVLFLIQSDIANAANVVFN